MEKRGKLIILCGPSGVGKGTLLAKVLKNLPDATVSISATTRLPRSGEIDGKNYFFISKEQFIKDIENGEFLEWAEYAGNYYGTPIKAVQKSLEEGISVILEIEIQGASQIKEKINDVVMIFILPPSFEELKTRLKGRNTETEESIAKRLAIMEEEMAKSHEFDYLIINDSLERASQELQNVILSEINT